jgi:NAD(P)-dependent dehydrogenase (short-subunit alcohol dehydrogenase family)
MKEGTAFDGRVVFITGASRGIGLAVAAIVSRMGGHVVLGSRSRAALDRRAHGLAAEGLRATACALDVADPDQVNEAVHRIERSVGPIQVLVNNAGTAGPLAPIYAADRREWERTVKTNLMGPFYILNSVLPFMAGRGSGVVVNVSSAVVHVPMVGTSAYGASKAGLDQLTKTAALEARSFSVRVNGLYPGMVDTAMQEAIRSSLAERGMDPGDLALFRAAYREGRLRRPEDAARAVCWLAGPWSEPLTGAIMDLDDPAFQSRVARDFPID